MPAFPPHRRPCRNQGNVPMSIKDDMKSLVSGKKPGVDAAAIRELSVLLAETGLTEIEIEHNGARIRVSRAATGVAVAAPAATPAAAPSAPASGPHLGAVPSPMVGTVYLAPEPGKPNFVKVGQSV